MATKQAPPQAQQEPPEPRSEQEVIARFQAMRGAVNKLVNQIGDLSNEAAEHDLVIKQLEPMDKGRRCYRMIGDVLVERTVAETLPAVQRNREGLEGVMKALKQQLKQQTKALVAFQAKYKIRASAGGGNADDGDEDEDGDQAGSKQQQKPGGSSSSSAAGGGSRSKQGGGVLC